MPASGWIGFQTNGQLLGAKRAQSLAAAGVDRIAISAYLGDAMAFPEAVGDFALAYADVTVADHAALKAAVG